MFSIRTKIISVLLALVCLLASASAVAEGELRGYSSGDGYVYVTLGNYMQSIDGGEPQGNTWTWSRNVIKDTSGMTFTKDPILWRVISVDDEKAILVSEYVLFAMGTHQNITEYKTIGSDFGKTELSAYLNGTFASEAFTDEEMSMLLPCETFGKVFLMDSTEVKDKKLGFGNGEGMKAWGTEYAIRVTGLFVYKTQYGSHSPYWVRNQSSSDARHARCTKERGTLGHIIADRENEGVRPEVYLDMNAFTITGGDGTKTSPYVLAKKAE